eukprot:5415753-Amphidinium_carterae.1
MHEQVGSMWTGCSLVSLEGVWMLHHHPSRQSGSRVNKLVDRWICHIGVVSEDGVDWCRCSGE